MKRREFIQTTGMEGNGPGNGDMAHTANEHIYINDVVDFSKILVEFLKEDQT